MPVGNARAIDIRRLNVSDEIWNGTSRENVKWTFEMSVLLGVGSSSWSNDINNNKTNKKKHIHIDLTL